MANSQSAGGHWTKDKGWQQEIKDNNEKKIKRKNNNLARELTMCKKFKIFVKRGKVND